MGKWLRFYKLCAAKAGGVDWLKSAVEAYGTGEDGVEEFVYGVAGVGGCD